MNTSELLDRSCGLPNQHLKAINDAVAAACPGDDSGQLYAVVLAILLGMRLRNLAKTDREDTVRAINVSMNGYKLIGPARTDGVGEKTSSPMGKPPMKARQDIKRATRLTAMPPDDAAKEIYRKFAQCLDEYLAEAIAHSLQLPVEAAKPIAEAIIRLRTQQGERKQESGRFMAWIAFSGYGVPQTDVDAAQAALHKAGYGEVHRMPEKYRQYLDLPLDDHMEVVYDDPNVSIEDINAIVGEFGGDCAECGPIAADYKPFVRVFCDMPGFVP
jgi:hypothetical protein